MAVWNGRDDGNNARLRGVKLTTILLPSIVATLTIASCYLYLTNIAPRLLRLQQQSIGGVGGNGGDVGSISGGNVEVTLGEGGAGGCGNGIGGIGGGAGDISGTGIKVITGSGGNAGTCDGRGGKPPPGPAEVDNLPSGLWPYGRAGAGANAAIYNERIAILAKIRKEYLVEFPDEVQFVEAGIDQVPINWVNKRLEELKQTWRVKMGKGGYIMPNLTPAD